LQANPINYRALHRQAAGSPSSLAAGHAPQAPVGAPLKKSILLIVLILIALALDGTLNYELFDFSTRPVAKAVGILLFLFILGTLVWAEAVKKDGKKNNPE